MIRISFESGELDITYEESTFHLSEICTALQESSEEETVQKLIENLRDIVAVCQDINLDKIRPIM